MWSVKKVNKDFGEYTDDINEYLSSVSLSIDAFLELIEYYKTVERDVIIVMLGDHGPAFISDLISDKELTNDQQEIMKRAVPYYVWSNIELKTEVFSKYAPITDIVPLLLKAANMPLTGYYKSIIDLHEKVPIRTSTGYYMDINGCIGKITQDYEYYNIIQNYYFLEYNNLTGSRDYNEGWYKLNSTQEN